MPEFFNVLPPDQALKVLLDRKLGTGSPRRPHTGATLTRKVLSPMGED